MKGAFVSRRRADEFDALLSDPARTGSAPSPHTELLELVGALRAVPLVAARPDFVADLRSRLVVEAARQALPVADPELRLRLTPRQRRGVPERRAATVLGGFAMVAASGSMAMASQTALPGDVLYPVKRAIENVETNLQSDDAAKARTLISHAQRRLAEAEQLTAEGADAATVAATLQDFTEQSSQAAELALDDYTTTGDQDAIDELRAFADDSMTDLDELGEVVPADARGALITAARAVQQADSAAFQACPTCGDEAVTELPDFATASAALVSDLDGLLSLQRTDLSEDIAEVEEIVAEERESRRPQHQGTAEGRAGVEPTPPPADDPGIDDPATDPPDTPDDPVGDLEDKLENDLRPDRGGLDDPVGRVGGEIDDVTELVEDFLGGE